MNLFDFLDTHKISIEVHRRIAGHVAQHDWYCNFGPDLYVHNESENRWDCLCAEGDTPNCALSKLATMLSKSIIWNRRDSLAPEPIIIIAPILHFNTNTP